MLTDIIQATSNTSDTAIARVRCILATIASCTDCEHEQKELLFTQAELFSDTAYTFRLLNCSQECNLAQRIADILCHIALELR